MRAREHAAHERDEAMRLSLAARFFPAVALLCALLPRDAAAQLYRPERLHPSEAAAPMLNLSLSPASIQALNDELEDDLRALDAFSGGRRGIDRFPRGHEAHGSWRLYGRFYLVNFQNKIDRPGSSTSFTWRRTGPKIGGTRIFIAVHRKF